MSWLELIVDSVMCFNNIIKGTKWGISGPKVGILLQSKSCHYDIVGLLSEGLQGIPWQNHTYTTHILLSTHVFRVTDTLPLAGEIWGKRYPTLALNISN